MLDADALMREAIALAQHAASIGEVPIGCVVVDDLTSEIIGRGYNRREADHDPTAHAEILALRQAARTVGNWRVEGTLYRICEDPRLNHRVAVTPAVLGDECAALLRDFFRARRALGKK